MGDEFSAGLSDSMLRKVAERGKALEMRYEELALSSTAVRDPNTGEQMVLFIPGLSTNKTTERLPIMIPNGTPVNTPVEVRVKTAGQGEVTKHHYVVVSKRAYTNDHPLLEHTVLQTPESVTPYLSPITEDAYTRQTTGDTKVSEVVVDAQELRQALNWSKAHNERLTNKHKQNFRESLRTESSRTISAIAEAGARQAVVQMRSDQLKKTEEPVHEDLPTPTRVPEVFQYDGETMEQYRRRLREAGALVGPRDLPLTGKPVEQTPKKVHNKRPGSITEDNSSPFDRTPLSHQKAGLGGGVYRKS